MTLATDPLTQQQEADRRTTVVPPTGPPSQLTGSLPPDTGSVLPPMKHTSGLVHQYSVCHAVGNVKGDRPKTGGFSRILVSRVNVCVRSSRSSTERDERSRTEPLSNRRAHRHRGARRSADAAHSDQPNDIAEATLATRAPGLAVSRSSTKPLRWPAVLSGPYCRQDRRPCRPRRLRPGTSWH